MSSHKIKNDKNKIIYRSYTTENPHRSIPTLAPHWHSREKEVGGKVMCSPAETFGGLALACHHWPFTGRFLPYVKQVQGPVVRSIVILTSSLVVNMLTVLVSSSTISNSHVFLLKTM